MTRDRIISYRFYCRFLLLLVKCVLLLLTWKDSPTALLLDKKPPSKICLPKNQVKFTTLTQTLCKQEGDRENDSIVYLIFNGITDEWCGDWKAISYKRFHCIQFSISWLRKFQRNWLCGVKTLCVCLFFPSSPSAAPAAASSIINKNKYSRNRNNSSRVRETKMANQFIASVFVLSMFVMAFAQEAQHQPQVVREQNNNDGSGNYLFT